MEIKEELYAHCLHEIRHRIERIRSEIEKVQASANQETKSSAGDKYETGRAMAQQEIDLNRRQLVEAEKQEAILLAIDSTATREYVSPGSMVTTSGDVFFVAVSMGSVLLTNIKYFVVSPESPIGKLLIGKRVGESLQWNGKEHFIKSVE